MDKYVRVEDVMSFINTSNRGNSDYFIVDQIEDLCKNKAKTLEELKKEQSVQKCSKKVVAQYSYEHNDGDQIWDERTTYYQLANGTFQKEYYEGYYDKTNISPATYNEIVERMSDIEKQAERRKRSIETYGYNDVFTRNGYIINVPFQKEEVEMEEAMENLNKDSEIDL